MPESPFVGRLIVCPLCRSDDHTVISERDRRGAPLRTVLCSSCGHVFTNPQPTSEELETFYTERYRDTYKGVTTPKQKHIYRAGTRALERLVDVQAYCQPGSTVLDIGSGGGEFVYLLQKTGYVSRGIEPNRGYAEFSKDAYGVDVVVGSLDNTPLEESHWDVVTLHHVLEHLPDPIRALRLIGRALRDGGTLIVEVPNVEARYHGPRRLFHLAHLHSFCVDGLQSAAIQAGFTPSRVQLQPHTSNIRAVFKKDLRQTHPTPDKDVAQRVGHALKTYTPARDYMTLRPYRRFWANLKRPIKEKLALSGLGRPVQAKDVLDRLYEREAAQHLVN